MTVKAGQKCTAVRRIIVPEKLVEDVKISLGKRLSKTTIGDPSVEGVRMGSLAGNEQKIEVTEKYKHLQIREITDSGGYHRRVITPDEDISGEVQKIQDLAEAEWTDEVKSAWTTFQAEQEAQRSTP